MTISFIGGTGVSTTGAGKGTTSTTVAYNNVAAGRLGLLTVGAKPNTGTITTPSGWTKITEATGGTGTNAADTGLTKVAVYYKLLDGTETGSVTVSGTSTGSIQGSMDVYSKTRASWDLDAFVVGSDATHGTNFSAVCGAWSLGGVFNGDHIFVAHSGDTDDAATGTTTPTITQSGMTISTVTGRSQVRNTSGNQGMTYTWSGTVGAATTPGTSNIAAPTVGFTWTVSSCGPAIALRIREYDAISTIVDTFSTGSTPNATTWPSTSGSPTVSSGTMKLNSSGFTMVSSPGAFKLKGSSFVVQFPVSQSSNGSYAGLRIAPYDTNTFLGSYNYFDPTGHTTAESQAAGSDAGYLDVTYNSAVTWRKIDYTGANVLIQTSSNGTSWTTLRTVTPTAWMDYTNLVAILEAGNGTVNPDNLEVDNVNSAPSTTPVSSTIDLRWAVQNTVTGSTDLRWAVRNTVTGSTDLRWAVQNTVTGSTDLRWGVLATVAGTIDLRWAALASVTGSLDLRWAQRSLVSGSTDLRWAVASTISSGIDLRWKVANTVSSGIDLRWAVQNSVSGTTDLRWVSIARLTGSMDLRWAVANTVAGSTDLRWAVLNSVSGSTDLRWATRALVSSGVDLRWAVANTISGSTDLRWAVLASVSGSTDLRWIVLNAVSGAIDLRWVVVSTTFTISGSVDLQWAQRNIVTSGVDLRWSVRALTSGTIDLPWSVRAAVAGSTDLRWTVRAAVGSSLDLRWAVRNLITGSTDLRWKQLQAVTGGLDLQWATAGNVSGSLALVWNVRSALSGSLNLPWTVRGQISSTLDLRWRVRALLVGSTQLLWVVDGVAAGGPPPAHIRARLTDRLTVYPERISNVTDDRVLTYLDQGDFISGSDRVAAYLDLWP